MTPPMNHPSRSHRLSFNDEKFTPEKNIFAGYVLLMSEHGDYV